VIYVMRKRREEEVRKVWEIVQSRHWMDRRSSTVQDPADPSTGLDLISRSRGPDRYRGSTGPIQ